MSFEIDHDWEGNLATPKARIGEKVKIRLLILLCAIWVILGLFSHQPWKPEAESISIIQHLLTQGNPLLLSANSDDLLTHPPLYYWVSAGFVNIFSAWLSVHDAARLSNALWLAMTLMMMGMTGRELWGQGAGRQASFILISCIGLIYPSHLLNPYVAGLAGLAMGFYAISLSQRRPYRAALLLASAIAITFLSVGLLHSLILLITLALLPLVFPHWRNQAYRYCALLALLLGLIPCAAWLVAMQVWHAPALLAWWQQSLIMPEPMFAYISRTLLWFSWPALPIALWGAWIYRYQWLQKAKLQLLLCFFLVAVLCLGVGAEKTESSALVLLLPLVALASGSVEKLKRGAAGALNWFGLIVFGLLGLLIWLGWFAIAYGWPAKLAVRMQFLSGLNQTPIAPIALAIALSISVIWLLTVHAKRSNRAAVTDWAVGMTMAWTLLMSLWLPMLDSAKSYASVALSLQAQLPQGYHCISSIDLTSQQENLLSYHLKQGIRHAEWYQEQECDLLLVRYEHRYSEFNLSKHHWKVIWQDKRPADRHDRYVLYRNTSH